MSTTRDKGGITMKNRSSQHCGFWAKAVALMLAGLFLILLPDWGTNLRAQTPLIDAVDDTAIVVAGSSVNINVLANDDTGASFGGIVDSVTVTGSPANGSAVVGSGNSIIYSPNPGFAGSDTFTYTLFVGFNTVILQDTATVTVTVNPPGLNAVDDTATTAAITPVTINVLANDTPNTGVTVAVTSVPAQGAAVRNADNTITYTPNAGFAGTDTFTYAITDSFGQTDTATVTVTVNPPGLNAVDDTATTAATTPVTVTVLANDSGTGLTVTQ
ncbi:MAG: cadherin-like domain-containing protein, partial [Candidatus Competibacteraceae bacterium]|nr:cadherin-like domain-containing protein [Candidatus Competibacteraceae bacterium]